MSGFSGDGGQATSAKFNNPLVLWGDSSNSYLYIADAYNYRIRRVDRTTGIITTIAGTGSNNVGSDGPATSSALFVIRGMGGDTVGNLFISDSNVYDKYNFMRARTR